MPACLPAVPPTHLHPIVLVIHVLQPGNELAGVETISDGFVFISLQETKEVGGENIQTKLVVFTFAHTHQQGSV